MSPSAPRPRRRTRAPNLTSQIHPIRWAAVVEAVAAGHDHVDVDDLLLGLSVAGGPSAWELARMGADLPALRRASAQVRDDPAHARSTVRAADRFATDRAPLTERALRLLRSAPHRGDDRALLAALIDEGDGDVRRLLGHLGIDVETLRRRAADRTPWAPETGEPPTWVPVEHLTPTASGRSWTTVTHAQSFPVSADRVWPVISDPARRTEWDFRFVSVSVGPDGVERLTRPEGGVVTESVVDVVAGQRIAWRRHDQTDEQTGSNEVVDVLQVVLGPHGTGTTVSLRRDSTGRGIWYRLLRPVLHRGTHLHLRMLAQAIHQAAA